MHNSKFEFTSFPEDHLIIDWFSTVETSVMTGILKDQSFENIKTFTCKPNFANHIKFISGFYNLSEEEWMKGPNAYDKRGSCPFRIYIFTDPLPLYQLRSTTSQGIKFVNTNTFNLKQILRSSKKYSGMFHATNNIHETQANLQYLGLYKKPYDGIKFSNLESVFAAFKSGEKKGFKWLVLRNYEQLNSSICSEEHGDIDFLVSNFYQAKALLKSRAITKNCKEDKGSRVYQCVEIGGKNIPIDLRYPGDGYMCENWMKDLLETRVKYKNFFIPNSNNYIYSLIYHALVHKRRISDDYAAIFKQNCLPVTKKDLLNKLIIFMHNSNYSFTRPEDSVVFNIEI